LIYEIIKQYRLDAWDKLSYPDNLRCIGSALKILT